MKFLFWLIFGFVAGIFATILLPMPRGEKPRLLIDVSAGVIGSIIGGGLFRSNPLFSLGGAAVGAFILILIGRTLRI